MSEPSEDSDRLKPVARLITRNQILHMAKAITFIDLEMSGGDPERHWIIQSGGVLANFPSLNAFCSFEQKVRPVTLEGCQWRALRIAHFSRKGWKDAVGIHKAMRTIRQHTCGRIVAGWDLSQDLKFIEAACRRTGTEFPRPLGYLDVQHWAQDRLNLPQRPGLQAVADMLRIPRRTKHDALEDSRAMFHIFRMLWQYSPQELQALTTGLLPDRVLPNHPIRLARPRFQDRMRELLRYITTDPSIFMRHERVKSTGEVQLLSRQTGSKGDMPIGSACPLAKERILQ